jgi:chromosome segregation ATPase
LSHRETELAEREHGHDEAAQLAETLSRREAELGDLQEALARAEDDATRLTNEVQARDGLVVALEGELAALKEAKDHGQNEAAQLADALSQREAELAELRQAANQLADRDRELADLREALSRAEEEATRLVDHGSDEVGQLAEALSARDGQLAARERELAGLHQAYGHRHDQAARFARRLRQTGERIAELESRGHGETHELTQSPNGVPAGYLVFAQFARRYALVEREGVVPEPDATLELPDFGPGKLRIVRIGPSPLPNDSRSCVFTEYVHDPA